MRMLICYDIAVGTGSDRRRYRKVVRFCKTHGIRIQKSVFQMEISYSQSITIKDQLNQLIDKERDSLLFVTQHTALSRSGIALGAIHEEVWIF